MKRKHYGYLILVILFLLAFSIPIYILGWYKVVLILISGILISMIVTLLTIVAAYLIDK